MANAFSLQGVLGLDITKFKNKLSEANKNLNSTTAKFKKSTRAMKKGFKGVTKDVKTLGKAFIGLGLAATAFGLIANRSLAATREIKSLADTLGVSTDRIQGLTIAFSQFNLEADDVGDVLNTLADRSQDATDGMQSFIDDFRLIGIEVDDLRGKSPGKLFDIFADAIQRTEDPVKRQSALVRILGDDLGRKLGPALLEGSAGFERMFEEAKAAGAIMSGGVVLGAANAKKELDKLGAISKNVVNKAFAQMGPLITLTAKKMEAFAAVGGGLDDIVVPAMKNVVTSVGFVGDAFRGLSISVTGSAVAFEGLKSSALFALKGIRDFLPDIVLPKFKGPTDKDLGDALSGVTKAKADLSKLLTEKLPSEGAAEFNFELDQLIIKLEQTANEADAMRIKIEGGLGANKDNLIQMGKAAETFGRQMRTTLGSEIESALTGNFSNIGNAFKSMLTRMVADALAADLGNFLGLGGALGGGSTGANFLAGAASFLGGSGRGGMSGPLQSTGKFANGGTPPIGKASIVGERGPELFIPNQGGTIIPNEVMNNNSRTVNQTIIINTPNASTFNSARGRIGAQLANAVG